MNLSLKSVASSTMLWWGFLRPQTGGWTRCRTNAQTGTVRLLGLKLPVHISWYYLKRSDGKLENALVLCTKALKGSTMTWWVVTAGFLKAFSRPQNIGLGYTVGQGTLLGVYRWLILSLTSYLLAYWVHLHLGGIYRIGVKQHSQLLNSFFHWWHYYYWHRFNAYNL